MMSESQPPIGMPTPDTVRIGKEISPIKHGEVLQYEGFKIGLYTFADERGKQSDGALFDIEPHASSSVMKLVEPGYEARRIAIGGSGWFLGISPEGEIETYKIGAQVEDNPEITLHEGWTDVLIAGENGLQVLDISTPPFQPHMETPVKPEEGHQRTSASAEDFQKFWELYDNLKAGNIPEDLR